MELVSEVDKEINEFIYFKYKFHIKYERMIYNNLKCC